MIWAPLFLAYILIHDFGWSWLAAFTTVLVAGVIGAWVNINVRNLLKWPT
jgi:hypothetical protein